MTPDEITKSVKDWFNDISNWSNTSNKSPSCIDWRLIQQGELIRNKSVLNIGCFIPGDEITFSHLASHWDAIDFCAEVITRCRQLAIPTATFQVMDARAMSFPSETYDVVLDFSSGDQMPEEHYNEVLKEIYRVLKPDGKFIVTFANYAYFNVSETSSVGYSRCYTIDEMTEKVSSVGFKLDRVDGVDTDRAGMIWVKDEI